MRWLKDTIDFTVWMAGQAAVFGMFAYAGMRAMKRFIDGQEWV